MRTQPVDDVAWAPDAQTVARLRSTQGTCYAAAARRAARLLTATYDQALAPHRLRVGQFSLLYTVALRGPIPLAELAQVMAMDRTTMATNLKPLTREGLLTVQQADRDRRIRDVGITRAGLTRLMAALPAWEQAQAEFADALGDDRAARLRAELHAVLDAAPRPW